MLGETILNGYISILGGATQNMTDLMLKSPSQHFGGTLWGGVSKVYVNFAIPLAIGMMVIFFLLKLTETSIELGSEMSLQAMLKPMLGFVLGLTIIMGLNPGANNGKTDVMVAVVEFGHSVTNELATSLGMKIGGDTNPDGTAIQAKNEEMSASINEIVKKPEFSKVEGAGATSEVVLDKGYKLTDGGQFSDGMRLLLPFLARILLQLIAMYAIYGRILEMYIRFALAPIALSDMFVRGSDSVGFRYLKSFLALMLQGAVLLFVFYLNGLVSTWVMKSGISMAYVAITMAQVVIIGKTGGLAKSLVGVN